jgi:hypothetical protein
VVHVNDSVPPAATFHATTMCGDPLPVETSHTPLLPSALVHPEGMVFATSALTFVL